MRVRLWPSLEYSGGNDIVSSAARVAAVMNMPRLSQRTHSPRICERNPSRVVSARMLSGTCVFLRRNLARSSIQSLSLEPPGDDTGTSAHNADTASTHVGTMGPARGRFTPSLSQLLTRMTRLATSNWPNCLSAVTDLPMATSSFAMSAGDGFRISAPARGPGELPPADEDTCLKRAEWLEGPRKPGFGYRCGCGDGTDTGTGLAFHSLTFLAVESFLSVLEATALTPTGCPVAACAA